MSKNGYGQGVADQNSGRSGRSFNTYIERQNYDLGRAGK